VAQPEERKFLGFSISNDGSERRIAPKALDKFKTQLRDMTRRTRGISVPQLIEDLRRYLIGWRGYFGFCQTPRVLTNLEAWIRRRLRSYLWRFADGVLAHVRTPGRPTSPAQPLLRLARSPPTPCLCLSLTYSNRRVRDPYARWCGRGGTARCPPIPIIDPFPTFGPVFCTASPLEITAASAATGDFAAGGLPGVAHSHSSGVD
jgi:hypothetical protein